MARRAFFSPPLLAAASVVARVLERVRALWLRATSPLAPAPVTLMPAPLRHQRYE